MNRLPTIPHAYRRAPLTRAVLAALYGSGPEQTLAAPSPAGTEFRVNTYVTNDQNYPAVAMDTDGDFVVTWESWAQKDNSSANQWDIYAQRYNAAGVAQGGEFHVNTFYFTSSQADSAVAMDADGDFVVVWESYLLAPPPLPFMGHLGQTLQRSRCGPRRTVSGARHEYDG